MILLNACSRYSLKVQPQVIEMASEYLNPANNGLSKIKNLKDTELIRLIQSLLFYHSVKNVQGALTCIPISIINFYCAELLTRFKLADNS